MLMRRKEISAASEAIIREQNTKEGKISRKSGADYRCGRIGTDRTTGNLCSDISFH